MFPDKFHRLIELFPGHTCRMAQNYRAGVLDLIVEEFTEILHVYLCFFGVHYGSKSVELYPVYMEISHRFYYVAQFADSGRLNEYSVRRKLFRNLSKSSAEITYKAAAYTSGIHFIYLDSGVFQKSSVNADLAEFIFNQPSERLEVGEQYRSAVTLVSDNSVYKEFPVLLCSRYQGEESTARTGSSVSTGVTEWELVDGSYVDSGRTVGCAAFMGTQAKLDKETSVTFTVTVAADSEYDLTIRSNNSYIVASSGEKGYAARELNLSHVMDVSVDGGEARAVD